GFLHRGVVHNGVALNFVNYTLRELATVLNVKDPSVLARQGLVLSTTLDLNLQNKILKIAQKHIAELTAAHHMTNAAVVLIDYHNGAIRTLLGGINPNDQYDAASQGFRQPGSSFKPLIYATAFEQGVS